VRSKIDFLIKRKVDFKLKLSNYTTEIICPEIPFFNINYLKKPQNNAVFSAAHKIKHDLTIWTANEMPELKKQDCKYFDMSARVKKITSTQCTNIDLTAAYITILFNDFFISEETFNFVMRLPKLDRLAAVGMLASHKQIFTYQNGIPIIFEEITNPLENYFYYCVNRTAEIMDKVKLKLENDFIFTWVDSIYFIDNDNKVNEWLVSEMIKDEGLKFKVKTCDFLQIKEHENFVNITFYDPDRDLKTFNIPTREINFKKKILQYYNLV
jgi:hypothetical protein